MAFQSTRPLRGATEPGVYGWTEVSISIHAPLAGRDPRGKSHGLFIEIFQSTRPLRGATIVFRAQIACVVISIHAPLAGRDNEQIKLRHRQIHFNPRAPCGARRIVFRAQIACVVISIHAPLAGRDNEQIKLRHRQIHFNPRAPCGARRIVFRAQIACVVISIHAPLAGRDSKNAQKFFCIFAITDNKRRKTNIKRRLSKRFHYKSQYIYSQKHVRTCLMFSVCLPFALNHKCLLRQIRLLAAKMFDLLFVLLT